MFLIKKLSCQWFWKCMKICWYITKKEIICWLPAPLWQQRWARRATWQQREAEKFQWESEQTFQVLHRKLQHGNLLWNSKIERRVGKGFFKGKSKHYVDLKLQFLGCLMRDRLSTTTNSLLSPSNKSYGNSFFFGFFSVETFAMNQQSKFQGWFWVHQNMSQFHVSVCDPLPLIQFVSFIFAVNHNKQ